MTPTQSPQRLRVDRRRRSSRTAAAAATAATAAAAKDGRGTTTRTVVVLVDGGRHYGAKRGAEKEEGKLRVVGVHEKKWRQFTMDGNSTRGVNSPAKAWLKENLRGGGGLDIRREMLGTVLLRNQFFFLSWIRMKKLTRSLCWRCLNKTA